MILFVNFEFMKKEDKEIVTNERRTGDLQGINSILTPLAKKMLGKKAFVEADVICAWGGIVGEELAKYSMPIRVEFKKGERTDGVLLIEVASGAFALELQLKTRLLIDKVNSFFGYNAIKDIRLIQNLLMIDENKKDIQNLEKKLVTMEEETYIRNLSENIKNSELGQALERLGRAVVINNKK